jgi:hypothetical protein
MRPLPRVLEAILHVVPDSEVVIKRNLTTSFKSLSESYLFAAPEVVPLLWKEAAAELNWFCPLDNPPTPWKEEISDIFSARINYENYLDLI